MALPNCVFSTKEALKQRCAIPPGSTVAPLSSARWEALSFSPRKLPESRTADVSCCSAAWPRRLVAPVGHRDQIPRRRANPGCPRKSCRTRWRGVFPEVQEWPRVVAGSATSRYPVCTENLNPNVVVMKSAQDGVRTYDAESLNRTSFRHIVVQ